MVKDSIQTEVVPNSTEQEKANVATKRKKFIIATKYEETESETLSLEDSNESNEEYAGEEEYEGEKEVMPAKPTSKAIATTKDKGKGIQTMDTYGYVASNAYSHLFFTKKSKSLME